MINQSRWSEPKNIFGLNGREIRRGMLDVNQERNKFDGVRRLNLTCVDAEKRVDLAHFHRLTRSKDMENVLLENMTVHGGVPRSIIPHPNRLSTSRL